MINELYKTADGQYWLCKRCRRPCLRVDGTGGGSCGCIEGPSPWVPLGWKPISDIEGLPDFELLFAINTKRRDRSGNLEPVILEGFCAKVLREIIEREPWMPRHLRYGFTHFMTQADFLAAFPLPTE